MRIRLFGFIFMQAICPVLSGTIARTSFQVESTMRKIPLLIILLLAIGLTGCLEAQDAPTPTSSPIPTVILDIAAASDEFSTGSGCTVVAFRPTPGPTPASPYLPVTADEWSRGPADARFTLIQYSDFQ
jgi:hypothetical protein